MLYFQTHLLCMTIYGLKWNFQSLFSQFIVPPCRLKCINARPVMASKECRELQGTQRKIITARVRSTTGRLYFDTCLSVCPQGGYPYPIMLCNISQNAKGQTPGGGYPARSSWGIPRYGTPPPRPGQDGGGGTQLGQQKENSLHGARYASCVHAGGLYCLLLF